MDQAAEWEFTQNIRSNINIQYDDSFHSFKDGVDVNNDIINKFIDKIIINLLKHKNHNGAYVRTGNTIVFGFIAKTQPNIWIDIFVSKDYSIKHIDL